MWASEFQARAMQKALLIKAVLVGVILIALNIPLRMIDGIVKERAARQQAMVHELAAESYAKQMVAGPILTLPYVEEYDEALFEAPAKKFEKRRIERVVRFFPATNSIEGNATVETKSRGLFEARVFNWRAVARGEFVLDGTVDIARSRPDSRIVWGKPIISLLLSDPRGLVEPPAIVFAGRAIAVERGSGGSRSLSGLHAVVPTFDPTKAQRLSYTVSLVLHGTEMLAIVPLADDDRASLRADWPHPSFGGQFLPQPELLRQSAQGFEAQWVITALASNAQQQIVAWLDGKSECRGELCADRLEVRFFEPIDIYSLSDRALKYGFLFVALTFGCFALFEIVKSLAIHPAQYSLVGLALATFFLLLIALSEHVAFGAAYAVASAACVALIGFYLRAALGGVRRGLGFAALLAALYGALYGLLISEDNALLLGSLLVFALIAAAMTATRDFDWYSLRRRERPARDVG
jgi:inner membrane protein